MRYSMSRWCQGLFSTVRTSTRLRLRGAFGDARDGFAFTCAGVEDAGGLGGLVIDVADDFRQSFVRRWIEAAFFFAGEAHEDSFLGLVSD
jgi:hypothetical protein